MEDLELYFLGKLLASTTDLEIRTLLDTPESRHDFLEWCRGNATATRIYRELLDSGDAYGYQADGRHSLRIDVECATTTVRSLARLYRDAKLATLFSI